MDYETVLTQDVEDGTQVSVEVNKDFNVMYLTLANDQAEYRVRMTNDEAWAFALLLSQSSKGLRR